MVGDPIEAGADVNATGGEFGTTLHAADYAHDVHTVQLLLQHGANVTALAGEYETALQGAATRDATWLCVQIGTSGREGVATMKPLSEHSAAVDNEGGKYEAALWAAVKSRNLHCVKWLLDQRADVTAKGGMYRDALAKARMMRHWSVVNYLEQRFGRGDN